MLFTFFSYIRFCNIGTQGYKLFTVIQQNPTTLVHKTVWKINAMLFQCERCSVKRDNLLPPSQWMLYTHHNIPWVISNTVFEHSFKHFFSGSSQGLCEKGMFINIPAHIHCHTHTCTLKREREKDYTYICIHLSPNDCKESFNSHYIMVHLPRVFQNGSIITSHVCSLLNYLSLFPGGKRQGGRQLIQCKWKAFEAPYGEDVITVRQLIT